jgi:hypothetical protein
VWFGPRNWNIVCKEQKRQPGSSDAEVIDNNLADWALAEDRQPLRYVCVRGSRVEQLRPIAATGVVG